MTQADEQNTQDDTEVVESEESHRVDEADDRGVSVPSIGIMAFLAVLAVGVVLQAVIHLTSDRSDHPVIQVVVQGQVIQLAEDEIPEFNDALTQQISKEHERLASDIEIEIEANVDALFDEAVGRVPDYVEWYYTLPASTFRLYSVVTGGLEAHFERTFEELVLDGDAFSDSMRELEAQLDSRMESGFDNMREHVGTALLDRYESDTGTDDLQDGGSSRLTVELKSGFESSLAALRRDEFLKLGVYAAAGGSLFLRGGNQSSIAGRVVQKSSQIQQAIAQRWGNFGRRVVRRSAPLAGGIPGIGVMVAAEAAILEVQRRTTGVRMEEDIKDSLLLVRDDVKEELKLAYRNQVKARHHAMMDELKSRAAAARGDHQFFVLGGAPR